MMYQINVVNDVPNKCAFGHHPQNIEQPRGHDYGDGLLVYREGDELGDGEEGYSSAVSEEEVKYDPSVWQSVIRYGPEEQDLHHINRGLEMGSLWFLCCLLIAKQWLLLEHGENENP